MQLDGLFMRMLEVQGWTANGLREAQGLLLLLLLLPHPPPHIPTTFWVLKASSSPASPWRDSKRNLFKVLYVGNLHTPQANRTTDLGHHDVSASGTSSSTPATATARCYGNRSVDIIFTEPWWATIEPGPLAALLLQLFKTGH